MRWSGAIGGLTAAIVASVEAPQWEAPLRADVPVASIRNADSLAGNPAVPGRDKSLVRWAGRASLSDILYVLRRPPSELRAVERELVKEALERVRNSRPELRSRLISRMTLLDRERASRPLSGSSARALERSARASVFRVAALLPDSGAYGSYGQAVRLGIEIGLKGADSTAYDFELRVWPTGEDSPARQVAAFDSASHIAGSMIGELLSIPTLVLATAAHFAQIPMISPTATDENVGTIDSTIFQVGPSGYERGIRLARSVLAAGNKRVGMLVSSTAAPAFALGFADAVRTSGSELVWQSAYPAGAMVFQKESRAIAQKRVEVLFWDGDAREAEALVRQLAKDHVTARVCGGRGLAPEQFHIEARGLLTGVHYVDDEWRLQPQLEAVLDSVAEARSHESAGSLHVRGFVAGRALSAAIASGALCPEEIATFLRSRRARDRYLAERGFLDGGQLGLTIPVFVVTHGRANSAAR